MRGDCFFCACLYLFGMVIRKNIFGDMSPEPGLQFRDVNIKSVLELKQPVLISA